MHIKLFPILGTLINTEYRDVGACKDHLENDVVFHLLRFDFKLHKYY
jgi:hypothetical protein